MTKQSKSKPAKSRKGRRGRTKGALATVGGLLIASAVVRIVIGAGEAMALDGKEMPSQAPEEMHAEAKPTMVGEDTIAPLLEALSKREERVKKRELAIDRRVQALSVAEQEIDRRLIALEEAEERLRATLALSKEAAENDLAQLTDVYANMKPKQAAALFETMAPEFAAGFIARMRPDAAASVLAGLTPETAYTISVILAGRNANVPKE